LKTYKKACSKLRFAKLETEYYSVLGKLGTDGVNTKPQLEIWADDVKCSHGATTGKLDENALFYLQARGISKQVAKALLVQAFAGEILEKISDEKLKILLETQLIERFL
jgi:Fe-S cluster assembly protein SufD